MRPVSKGDPPIGIVFTEYGQARPELIDRIGDFCSYCENQITNPHTEHVHPKGVVPGVMLNWYNFLLACVNCNSSKGDDWIAVNNYYWPDVHNTYLLFDFYPYGVVTVKQNLHPSVNRAMAKRTLELTGLHRYGDSDGDRRWIKRSEAWGKASDALIFYRNNSFPLDYIPSIINTATATGFWSVWMKVFENRPEIQDALIAAFDGTHSYCRVTDINRLL